MNRSGIEEKRAWKRMLQRKTVVLLLVLLCALLGAAQAVEGEWIVHEEAEMTRGELRWFDDAPLRKLVSKGNTEWTTSDERIARVDKWGNVRALEVQGVQTAYITAQRGGVSYVWRVAVRPESEEVALYCEGERFSSRNVDIGAGAAQLQLSAAVLPEGAAQGVRYKVQGEGASIDENGLLTITGEGKYTVQATAADSGKAVGKAAVFAVYPVRSVALSGPAQLTGGDTAQLEATVSPENATSRKMRWSSSDESVAQVDGEGRVTGGKVVEPTQVVITAQAADGFGAQAQHTLTILPCAQRIDLTFEGKELPVQTLILDDSAIGEVYSLGASVYPETASQPVRWSSSNKKIVKVDSEGHIGVVGKGECRLTAASEDGRAKRVLYVVVGDTKDLPYYLEIDKGNQVVRVYERDEDGLLTKLIRRMVCSTGAYENTVANGLYRAHSARLEWMTTIEKNVYCQYGTRFREHIWFHSLPYEGTRRSRMDMEEYAKLGTNASHGCIRLLAADAKWIYENVSQGCWILMCKCERSEAEYGSLWWPEAQDGWDPTDPHPDNPCYDPTYTSLVSGE
ncbi:MAG: Ig-like domain-containing protein [Eubacteriales bacterium]|nr:Ig-like domain-containing protein [Eubacteriales bacterium]